MRLFASEEIKTRQSLSERVRNTLYRLRDREAIDPVDLPAVGLVAVIQSIVRPGALTLLT